jgi:hypothetical protein
MAETNLNSMVETRRGWLRLSSMGAPILAIGGTRCLRTSDKLFAEMLNAGCK